MAWCSSKKGLLDDPAFSAGNVENSPRNQRLETSKIVQFLLVFIATVSLAIAGLSLNLELSSNWSDTLSVSAVLSDNISDPTPIGHSRNGSYQGLYNPQYNQDLFLGIPYAQPPLHELRFVPPRPLQSTWQTLKLALSYSPQCNGYNSAEISDPQSEDCLTLNIVRPHLTASSSRQIPVVAWIYGGANDHGGSNDGRFNLSHIVHQSTVIGTPIMAVSMNYRASIWGFMSSGQIIGEANTNVGLHDQRLALQWIQENIRGFGGDPRKVTLWGASSGADSIGLHLVANGGRDDGLFRAAIMQSGGPAVSLFKSHYPSPQDAYDRITNITGCQDTVNSFACLQQVPFRELNTIFNNSREFDNSFMRAFAQPVVDGNLLRGFSSRLLEQGEFVHVPIMTGVTADEGGGYAPVGLNTIEDARSFLIEKQSLPSTVADRLLNLYNETQIVQNHHADPDHSMGEYFPLISTILGDLEITAASYLTCDAFSRAGLPTYCYRFNALPSHSDPRLGVIHATDLGPTFHNDLCTGFDGRCPFDGKGPGYFDLMDRITRSWIAFIHDSDPNRGAVHEGDGKIWDRYDASNPWVYRFDEVKDANGMESADERREGIEYIQSILASVLGK